jgi:hypothetical protein
MSGVDASQVIAFAEKLYQFDSALNGEARRTMQQSVDVVEAQVAAYTPVNTGTLRAGTTTDILGAGFNIQGIVINPVEYAYHMENGRPPGPPPPVEAIQLWVIRKGIADRSNSKSVAFLIARAIGRRGTKGAFMFKKGYQAALPTVKKLWADFPGRVVRRLVG